MSLCDKMYFSFSNSSEKVSQCGTCNNYYCRDCSITHLNGTCFMCGNSACYVKEIKNYLCYKCSQIIRYEIYFLDGFSQKSEKLLYLFAGKNQLYYKNILQMSFCENDIRNKMCKKEISTDKCNGCSKFIRCLGHPSTRCSCIFLIKKHCLGCGKIYCKKCITKDNLCEGCSDVTVEYGNTYYECGMCNVNVCSEDIKICCHGVVCEDCRIPCTDCGSIMCKKCNRKCSHCERNQCSYHINFVTCIQCNKRGFCPTCYEVCRSCRGNVCKGCSVKCKGEKIYCKRCSSYKNIALSSKPK